MKEILIYCYDELRLYLATKGYCSYLFSMTEIRDKYSSFDKIYLDASLQHIRQNGWLYGTNPNIVTLSPAGVLYIEKNYHPSGIIHFTTLIFPILRICNDLLDTKECLHGVGDFIDKLRDREGIIINKNEHLQVLHMLNEFGLIKVYDSMGTKPVFEQITPAGINYIIDHTPPNMFETIIESNIDKFRNLDYFSKEEGEIKSRLSLWINQFQDESEKKVASFMIDNLEIISNQWCLDRFNEFYEKEIGTTSINDVYIFPAGKCASSAEYWRHKFVRNIKGKENSRTLHTLQNEKFNQFWENKIVLFVDDIIGTGEQFSDFVKEYLTESGNLQDRFKKSKIIYFTPIATDFGIIELKKKIPNEVIISSGKVIKKLFDVSNPIWNKSSFVTKEKIGETCLKYGNQLNLGIDALGYEDSQLLIAFQDHTPDNTLPILWLQNGNYTPLLQR